MTLAQKPIKSQSNAIANEGVFSIASGYLLRSSFAITAVLL